MTTTTEQIKSPRKHYRPQLCRKCGSTIRRKGGLCIKCYKIARKNGTYIPRTTPINHHKSFPCRNKCGNKVRKEGDLCQLCYDKLALQAGEKRQQEKDKRTQTRNENTMERLKPHKVETCLKSPTQRHHWLIDSKNIGMCKYCGKKRNFKAKLKNYSKIIENTGD